MSDRARRDKALAAEAALADYLVVFGDSLWPAERRDIEKALRTIREVRV